MAHVITERFIGVKAEACVPVCPVQCISPGDDQFFTEPGTCIDCGACIPVCPVSAIVSTEEVEVDPVDSIVRNAEFTKPEE